MSKALILPTKFVRGWAGGPLGPETRTHALMNIREALVQTWTTDAHFAPYFVPDEDAIPRLNQPAVSFLRDSGAEVLISMLVLDVDCPEAHESEAPAPTAWRRGQLMALKRTPWWSTAGYYETRGGYRLLWELAEPMSPEQFAPYLQGFVRALSGYGIQADELKDWNRIYRLPFVNRDGTQQQPEVNFESFSTLSWQPNKNTVQQKTGGFAGIENVNAPLAIPNTIDPGNRNQLLTRIAGKYRRMGMNQEEVFAALSGINQSRCDPPVEDEELEQIAKSVCRYEPPVSSQGQELGGPLFQLGSDTEIAQVACTRLEESDGPQLIFDRSELWQYKEEQGIWDILPMELVRNVIGTFDGEKILMGVDRNGEPKTMPLKVGHRLCVNVANRICDQRYHLGFFDTAKSGLTFSNCFVYANDEGIQTEAFSPSQRATARLDFQFTHNLEPKAFIRILASCFQGDADCADKIRLIQQFVGVCLLGCATRMQKGMIFLGSGANGKSTVQKIVAELFSHQGSSKIISAIAPQDMEQEYRRALLAASRLNIVNELPEADILASESVKAMISGDLMTGRHIRQAPFEFVPKAGHLFAANSLPGVRDMSVGFWRRWLIIPFDRAFQKHEQIPGLAEHIIEHEIDAIASWALRGGADALRDGYSIPRSSITSIEGWRTDADQVASFLQYLLDKDVEELEPASKVYNEYCLWASNFGHRHLSAVKFSQRLSKLGVEKTRTSAGNFYLFTEKNPLSGLIH